MSSPFNVFRKYQKIALVVLIGLSMLSFVIFDAIQNVSDISTMPPLLVAITLAALIGAVAWALGISNGKSGEYGSMGVIAGLALGLLFGLQGRRVDTVTVGRYQISRNELQGLADSRSLAEGFLTRAILQTSEDPDSIQTRQAANSARLGFGLPEDQDLILGNLLRAEAKKINFDLPDSAVHDFIKQMTNQRMTKEDFREIRKQLRVTEVDIINSLKQELVALRAAEILYSRFPLPPAVDWEFSQQLQVRQNATVAAVPVAPFIDEQAQPPQAELDKLFAEYRENVPGRDVLGQVVEGRPGFYQFPRVRMAYITPDARVFREQVEVTDAEIEARYQRDYVEAARSSPFGSGSGSSLFPNGPSIPGLSIPGVPGPSFPPPSGPVLTPPATPDAPANDETPATPESATPPATEAPATPEATPPATPEQPAETPATPEATPPASETPAPETPAPEAPAAETPASESPAAETPAAETPAAETPAAEPANDGNCDDGAAAPPAAETPVETPAAETPAVETPAPATPATETPATEVPAAETVPAETPAGEAPAGDSPATPAGEAAGDDPFPVIPGSTEIPPTTPSSAVPPLDDELKAEIREQLVDEKALAAMSDAVSAANDELMIQIARDFHAPADSKDRLSEEAATKLIKEYAEKHHFLYTETDELMTYQELAASDDYPVAQFMVTGTSMTAKDDLFQSSSREIFRARLAEQIDPNNGQVLDRALFWKLAMEPGYVPENMTEERVRNAVVKAWRELQAREKAEARAKAIAEQVRKSEQPMQELLADVTVTGQPDTALLTISHTGQFSRVRQSIVRANTPQGFTFGTVRNSVQGLEPQGEDFMDVVFNQLGIGDVGVAPSLNRDVYYVVRIDTRIPANDEDWAIVRNNFLSGSEDVAIQQMEGDYTSREMPNWVDELFRSYDVRMASRDE